MARETTKWPSTRWPITKIMSSDGCNGNRVPLEMGPWYDFREFGCHLGNVGLMDPDRNEHLEPAYLDVNPQGLVPALVDGDLVLTQTMAIIEYLEEVNPQPPLFPANP